MSDSTPEPYTPTVDEMREAWLKWSAWKRIPTQGAGVAGPEFDRFLEGFVSGAVWWCSRSVEITEEMVEAGARALFDFDWRGEKSWLDVDRGVRVQYQRGFRAALAAALPVPSSDTITAEEE